MDYRYSTQWRLRGTTSLSGSIFRECGRYHQEVVIPKIWNDKYFLSGRSRPQLIKSNVIWRKYCPMMEDVCSHKGLNGLFVSFEGQERYEYMHEQRRLDEEFRAGDQRRIYEERRRDWGWRGRYPHPLSTYGSWRETSHGLNILHSSTKRNISIIDH